MNLIAIGILVFVAFVVVTTIAIQYRRAFIKTPVQATIRALVGFIALLIGCLAIPSFEGEVKIEFNNKLIKLEESTLKVTTGPSHLHIAAWCSVTGLLGVSLALLPKKCGS